MLKSCVLWLCRQECSAAPAHGELPVIQLLQLLARLGDTYGTAGRHRVATLLDAAQVYKAIWEELQEAVHAVDEMSCKTPQEAA
jgi:hypothetical protein